MSFQCKIKDESTPFSFTLSGKELLAGIDRMRSVTDFESSSDLGTYYMIAAYKKEVYLIGYCSATSVALRTGATEVSGQGACNIDTESLKKMFKNRGDIKFSFEGTLNFSAGRYKGDIPTDSITSDQPTRVAQIFSEKEKSEKAKEKKKAAAMNGGEGREAEELSPEILDAIKQGASSTAIRDVHFKKPIKCTLQLKGKMLTFFANDNYHMAVYQQKLEDKYPDFHVTMPSGAMALISSVAGDSAVKFQFASSGVRIEGEDFIFKLPPMQSNPADFEKMMGFVKELSKDKPLCSFTLGSEFIGSTQNLMALQTQGSNFKIKAAKGKLNVGLSSD